MNIRRESLVRLVVLIMTAAGIAFAGSGMYLYAKARLAQVLLEVAWRRSIAGAPAPRPWPWADTTPIARMRIERLHAGAIVLTGASGRNLAFGPAHLDRSALPGQAGNCVISAHRDTQFTVLRDVRKDDEILLEDRERRTFVYQVTGTRVVDRSDIGVTANSSGATLTLITCWPFDALMPGGRERYVVVARLVTARGSGRKSKVSFHLST